MLRQLFGQMSLTNGKPMCKRLINSSREVCASPIDITNSSFQKHRFTTLSVVQEKYNPLLSNTKRNLSTTSIKLSSNDSYLKPDRQFKAQSPYRGDHPQYRRQYKQNKYWTGGLLPRPQHKDFKDKPVKGMLKLDPKRDQWTQEKALFGQNDYIDILGDGTVHPADTMTGPAWLRRYNSHQFHRILRQFQFQGEFLKEHQPKKYHEMSKHLWYLYKKMNRRRRSHFWNVKGPMRKSRIDKHNPSKNFTY